MSRRSRPSNSRTFLTMLKKEVREWISNSRSASLSLNCLIKTDLNQADTADKEVVTADKEVDTEEEDQVEEVLVATAEEAVALESHKETKMLQSLLEIWHTMLTKDQYSKHSAQRDSMQ